MKKVIIINGSHRKGNSDLVIVKLLQQAEKLGLKMDTLVLREVEMNLPDGCEHCAEGERCPNVNDEFERKWLEKLKDYDSYIIVSPVWCDGPTPLTKIFIDRIVCFCHEERMWWKDKKVGVIAHGMADKSSWRFVTDWIKSVCGWQKAKYAGHIYLKSGAKVGGIKITDLKLQELLKKLN